MPILRPDFGGNFTRGSDTTAMHLRLFSKGVVFLLLIASVVAILVTAWRINETVERNEWGWYWRIRVAQQACPFEKDPGCHLGFTVPAEAGPANLTSAELKELSHSQAAREFLATVNRKFLEACWFGAAIGASAGLFAAGFFSWRGRRLKRPIHVEGLKLSPAWLLYWKLHITSHASVHKIGGYRGGVPCLSGVPMPEGSPNLNSVYVGATGTGKTQLIHQRLITARQHGEFAALYDDGGILLSHHFQDGDIVLNPLDARSAYWTPFSEIESEADCRSIAESLFPIGERTSDPVWANSARIWLTDILWALHHEGRRSNRALYETMKTKIDDLMNQLVGTAAGSQMAVDRTAESIRAELLSRAEIFRFLPDPPAGVQSFSIRAWALHPRGWLFFPVPERWQGLLKPLLSVWVDQLCLGILSREPDCSGPCTWILLDEVGSLHRLNCLERLLMKGRKFNSATILGLQTFAALRVPYGNDGAINILGNCHTRVVLLLTDPETAEQASKLFGDVTTLEVDESISMGPHAMRDGMTLSRREVRRRLLPPEVFMAMKRLTAYVRLPEDLPATFVHIRYKRLPKVVPAFVPRILVTNESASAGLVGGKGATEMSEGLAQLADELVHDR